MGLDSLEREFLRRVMLAGGYFDRSQARRLFRLFGMGTSKNAISKRIIEWKADDLVKEVGMRDRKLIYKLGRSALKLLGNGNSSIRRSHRIWTVEWKLSVLDFALRYWELGYELGLSRYDRLRLVERVGFLPEVLPLKRRGDGRLLFDCDQMLGLEPGLALLHVFLVDRPFVSVRRQFEGLFEDFEKMIRADSGRVRFHILVRDDERAWRYLELIPGEGVRVGGQLVCIEVESGAEAFKYVVGELREVSYGINSSYYR